MNRNRKIKYVLIVTLLAVILALQFVWDIASFVRPENIIALLDKAGMFAPVIYMIIMAGAVVISPIPSLPLNIAAGAFFGPFQGAAFSVTGALAGASASFLLSRYLGRDFIERYLGGHINFCVTCSDRVLTRIVFLSRLIPAVSFDIISYGAGLTKMSFRNYVLATFFGMIPLTFLYNYFGTVLVIRKTYAVLFGFAMVILFFALPRWIERSGIMKEMAHGKQAEE